MSKHILFDAISGILSARYDSKINTEIPAKAIAVDDELFFKTINEEDGIWSLVNSEIVKLPFPALAIPEQILARLENINAHCETAIAQISAGYPSSEVLSWPKQETEARAWLADNSVATPLIEALAAARGVVKADLVSRIIEKADLFAQVSGQLIGKRQGLEDQLTAMQDALNDPSQVDPTKAEIEAVKW